MNISKTDYFARNTNSPFIHMLIGKWTFIICLLLLIGGIGGQLQTAVFGDEIIPSVASGKVVLLAALLLGWLITQRIITSKSIRLLIWGTLITFIFFAFHILWLTIEKNEQLTDVLNGYVIYYIYIFYIPFAIPIFSSVNEIWARKYILWLGCIVAVIGVAQWAFSTPLLATDGSNGNFHVQSWDFYGHVRGFSLGVSPYDIGFMLTLALALSLSVIRWNVTLVLKYIPIILLLGVALHATLTRNVYLEATYAVLTIILIRTFPFRRMWLLPLPLVYVGANVYIVYITGAAAISKGIQAGFQGGIDNTATLSVRLSQWLIYLETIQKASSGSFFWGEGIVQSHLKNTENLLLDNSLLALIANVGIIGMICIVFILLAGWGYALSLSNQSTLALAIASLLSTTLAVGIFNIAIGVYGLVIMILLIVNHRSGSRQGISAHGPTDFMRANKKRVARQRRTWF